MLTSLAVLGLLAWAVWGMCALRCALDHGERPPICWACSDEPCSCDTPAAR